MKAFAKFSREYKAVAAIILSVLSTFISTLFEDELKDRAIVASLTAGIIGLSAYFTGKYIEFFFDSNKYLRRKFLGDDFIDGYYFDTSTDTSHVTLVQIKFKDESYTIEGQNYDLTRDDFGVNWDSEVACYKEKKLYVNYKQSGSLRSGFFEELGVLIIHFGGSPTSTYAGYYKSSAGDLQHQVRGIKVSEEELKEFNYFKDYAEKKKYFQQKLKALEDV